jgi:RNA polymerase sigma factor for flagellar operon FliA
MNELEERDRVIFRLHFDGGLSLAQISRVLRMDQKPLYRRLQRALRTIRQSLEAEGFTAADASEILASRCTDLDFGFSAPTTREEGL